MYLPNLQENLFTNVDKQRIFPMSANRMLICAKEPNQIYKKIKVGQQ